MKLNATLKVLSKDTKSGVSAKTGKEWTIDEYLLLEDLEREDGSHTETHITASASQMMEELKVGGIYNCTLFLTSRESSGKHYVSFRITYADLVSMPEEKEIVEAETISDECPF